MDVQWTAGSFEVGGAEGSDDAGRSACRRGVNSAQAAARHRASQQADMEAAVGLEIIDEPSLA